MHYSSELVDEVRGRSDIVSVISQYVKMTKRGSEYVACCPFHSEKTPSFHVSPSKQMYYCFGCGKGGNVLTFVMEYENYTFPEALKVLADRAGIALPEEEASAEEKERESLRSRMLTVNREAATYYYYQLRNPGGKHAWDYFVKRGLSKETMSRFGLGYSPMYRDDLYQYLKQKGYPDDLLNQSGLVKITERGVSDRFWNRAMFPIMDVNSRVIGFGGRVMGEGEPKYLNSPETPLFDKSRSVYGLNLARKSRRPYLLLCEGYMDVIALHQAGFDCAVASLGTAFTQGHAALMKRYAQEVVLTYDNDEAGIRAAMRAIPILRDAGFTVRALDLSPWNDPDEFIVREGAEAFQKRIDGAVNSFLYESDVLRKQYDFGDPEQKTRFHRALAEKLTAFPDELERNNYLEAVCARHGIPADALRGMVRRVSAAGPLPERRPVYGEEGPAGERRGTGRRRKKAAGLLRDEQLLLGWALSGEGVPGRLMRYLEPADFTDEVCRRLAERLWEAWRRDRRPDAASLLDDFQDEEEARNRAAAILESGLPEEQPREERDRILAGSVRRLRQRGLDAAARGETDPRKLQEIIAKKAETETMKITLL